MFKTLKEKYTVTSARMSTDCGPQASGEHLSLSVLTTYRCPSGQCGQYPYTMAAVECNSPPSGNSDWTHYVSTNSATTGDCLRQPFLQPTTTYYYHTLLFIHNNIKFHSTITSMFGCFVAQR